VNTSISWERLIVIALLFFCNVIMIAARSIYLLSVPVWAYVINACVLAAAVVLSVVDHGKSKKQKNSAEHT